MTDSEEQEETTREDESDSPEEIKRAEEIREGIAEDDRRERAIEHGQDE